MKIDDDELKEQQKKLINNLGSSSYLKQCIEQIEMKIINTKFEDDMNKQLYIIPLKNGLVMDIRTNEIYERTFKHKFNYEMNVEFIEDLKDDDYLFCDNYFKSLFKNDEKTIQCVLDIIKSSMKGQPLRYFFILHGDGRNGKSLFIKLIEHMFNNAVDILSDLVIVENKNKSNLNTEIEKLDKCRLGIITELNENDTLNKKIIKKNTGGDKMNLRTLQKTDWTLISTCSLMIATNNIPDENDKATLDRMVLIPFLQKYEVDNTYECKVLKHIDAFFSYIMKRGRMIETEFEFSDIMKEHLINYKNNTKNSLDEFIEESCELNKNDDTLRTKQSDFIDFYINHCENNNYKYNAMTKTKFTQLIKTKYGINCIRSNSINYYTGIKLNMLNKNNDLNDY